MFGLGAIEIAIIAFLALIFIGPKKLPELAKSMGKFIREFQNAMHGMNEQIQNDTSASKSDDVSTEHSKNEEKE